jgi:hypothetical protein
MTITCYLDSQDYSVLTDPRQASPDREKICAELRELASSGQVKFVFSAAVVSESVAVNAGSTHLAELKGDLLSFLCGSNALLSLDRLVRAEVLSLAARSPAPVNAFDPNGQWFPEIPPEEDEHPLEMARRRAEEDFASSGMSRQQRRAAARKLIKNGQLRGQLKDAVSQPHASSVISAELMQKYPMHPRYAETMGRYAIGRATHQEFHNALMASLADPKWIMKWFATTYELSHPISDLVRKPGRELGELLRKWVITASRWAEAISLAHPDENPLAKGGEITKRFLVHQETQLVQLVTAVAQKGNVPLAPVTAADVDQYCPGLSTCLRSLYLSAWSNVAGGRKEQVSDSQPVDALHAFYAPYVDVFRADKFMAPYIEKHASRYGTKVVPKLTQLLAVLRT